MTLTNYILCSSLLQLLTTACFVVLSTRKTKRRFRDKSKSRLAWFANKSRDAHGLKHECRSVYVAFFVRRGEALERVWDSSVITLLEEATDELATGEVRFHTQSKERR